MGGGGGQFVVKLVGKYQVKDVDNADFFSGVTSKDLVQFPTGRGSCPQKISVKFTEIKQLPRSQILVLIL